MSRCPGPVALARRVGFCLFLSMPLLQAQATIGASDGSVAAADLVDAALLTGPGFRVDPRAQLRGLQARFLIHTEWGNIEADSVEMLALRISELAAVASLHSHGVVDALKRAGIDSVSTPAKDAASLASSPMQRIKRLPEGVLRYFQGRVQSWSDRARRWGDRADRALSNEGKAASGFGLVEEKPAVEQDPWWDAPVDEVGRLLRGEAGHGRARRALARNLGIDPSTSNPLLRERLDKLAWAIAGQRLAFDYTLAMAAPGLARTIAQLHNAQKLTAEPEEEDLRRRNEQRLEHWTADADLRYFLAWRGAFSPEMLGHLLDQLAQIAPQQGGEAVLDVAQLARSELEARFVINSLRMLRSPQVAAASRGKFIPLGALLGYVDGSGEFYLPLPVDRLQWLSAVQGWFDHHSLSAYPHRSVLVAGGISPQAQRAITQRGWSLLSFIAFEAAPPYRSQGSDI